MIPLWNGECKDDLTRQFQIDECHSTDWCLEFLSTYIMLCKYGIHNQAYLVWLLYYVIVISIIFFHFIVSNFVPKWYASVTVLSIIQFIGISLVWSFDSHDVKGILVVDQIHYKFNGYNADNQSYHAIGVALFLIASFLTNVILLSKLISMRRQLVLYRFFIVFEELADIFYCVSIIAFLVSFLTNFVHPAIVLEYVVISTYFIMICAGAYFYVSWQKFRSIEEYTYQEDEMEVLHKLKD